MGDGDHEAGTRAAETPVERVRAEGRELSRERAAIVSVLAVIALASPVRYLWANPERPWWGVFVIWVVAVFGARWVVARAPRRRDDPELRDDPRSAR